ncbi:MAG: STAS domain-containing protein [Clostridia bacterium]|nr:STAS domain-containing protein [Clostridia bacterium]
MNEVQCKGKENGKLVFVLSGDIDSSKSDELYATVVSAFETDKASVEFECASLEFIDSTTLGTFVKILKAVKTHGFTVSFQNLKPNIKKLFLICSLDSIMEIA